jgi:hypothetical protein
MSVLLKSKQFYLFPVSHGAHASNHDLTACVMLQLLGRHTTRAQDASHEVVLHTIGHHLMSILTPPPPISIDLCMKLFKLSTLFQLLFIPRQVAKGLRKISISAQHRVGYCTVASIIVPRCLYTDVTLFI